MEHLHQRRLRSNREECFSACPDLEDVHLPSTVKEIGENAFYNCKMLRKLNMPEGVESVGANCFRYCNALTEGVYNEDCFFYLSEVNMNNSGRGMNFGTNFDEGYNGISISPMPIRRLVGKFLIK